MIVITQATSRVKVANNGAPFPSGTQASRTTYMRITAANNNAGTVYLAFQATQPANWAVARREQTLIPLTKGQSVEFRALGRGTEVPHDFVFGTGYSYVLGSATSQRINLTYYKWI